MLTISFQTLYTVTNKREEFMRGTVRLMAYLTRADQFTSTTQFRLVQRNHSGRDKDQWRLEDFAIMLSKIDPCKHRCVLLLLLLFLDASSHLYTRV